MSTDADKPFVIALEEHYWDADLVTMIFSHEDNRASDVEKCLLDVGELRLREMDEAGIDVQVLSHGAPGTHRMDADLAVRITRQTLFLQYKTEKAYTEKVSPRSRPDCERIMQMICDTVGKSGRRIGERQIREVTPRAADYEKIINGPNGLRLRRGEKVVGLCRKIWRIMRRLHPELFDKKHPNPWDDFTLKSRTKSKKHAVTREEVVKFAWGCITQGRPEPAAVAVICFEWLQRPEKVVAGLLTWPDYRSKKWPHAVRIEHHKNNKVLVWHPLEETIDGETIKFYAEAEDILSHLRKLGIPMIMRRIEKGEGKGTAKRGPIPAWKSWCRRCVRRSTGCRSWSRSKPDDTAA